MDLPARSIDPWQGGERRPIYAVPRRPASPAPGGELVETLRKLWRRWPTIILCGVAGTTLATAGALLLPTRYTAEARVLVGFSEPRVLSLEAIVAEMNPDAERVQNEALIIQSRELALQVIAKLALAENPAFNAALLPAPWWRSLVDAVMTPFRGLMQRFRGVPPDPSDAERATYEEAVLAQTLQSSIDVSAIGRSYVLSIKAQARNPSLAAAIANAFSGLYLERQRLDKIKATGQAEEFLDERVTDLRKQVQMADQAVEQYRQRYGLYKGAANAGVTTQQLTEINTQLTLAQTAKAEAESRLREAQAAGRSGLSGDSVPEVLRSPVIQALKQQQTEAERRSTEISSTFGSKHPRMTSIRTEIANIEKKLSAEIALIVKGLTHEANTAASRYESLRRNFESIKAQMGDVNRRSIQLDALERDAAAARAMLDETLKRSQQTLGQDRIMTANARLVSAAAPPLAPSGPPKPLLVFLGGAGGLLLGGLAALLREGADRSFRRAEDVVSEAGLPVLSMVPSLRRSDGVTALALRDPLSPFAEALRRLHIGLEMTTTARLPRTVMFASAVPAEGKSTLVASLGRLLASSGKRVLLVDCDWRCPSQARHFRSTNRVGLAAFLNDATISLEDALHRDKVSGLDVVPTGPITPETMYLLASDRMRATVDLFAKAYDLVLFDTPPVLVGAEVLALASMVDKVVFTIRWGHTPREVALDALGQVIDARASLAGIVLSRVDERGYRQYARSDLIYKYARPALVGLR